MSAMASGTYIPRDDELLFLPLGGAGEIGMNLNLYGHAGAWLMVDLGISFGDDTTPGIEVILPDPGFIVAARERLAGLVLTHAHEDHIGAVPYLWPQLRCPIYATPFTAAVLRRKYEEPEFGETPPITEIPMTGRLEVGPFALELVTLTHSIPEPNAVVIRTSCGTVLHTGDWKLDPEPLVGTTADEETLRRLGEEGVLAMVCDSTNALREGESGSEAAVRESLMDLVGRCRNRVVLASFASNVARLQTFAEIAAAHGRRPALVGRSLRRIVESARETGYLADTPRFLGEEEAAEMPRDEVMLICTGSQGEPRSALVRIVNGSHPNITLDAGDVAIFSSRIIPGNERAIFRLQNELVRLGVEVVTERDSFVHVSGHPARDELVQMYQWVKPRIAVPVHGEARHMREHARLAKSCQVPEAAVVENGDLLRLAPGAAQTILQVPSGRLGVDGTRLVDLEGPMLRERKRMMYNGSAVATLVVDGHGRLLADPRVSMYGLLDPEDEALREAAVAAARDAVETLPAADRADDAAMSEAVRRAVRRALNERSGRKPPTQVHVVRL